MFLINIFGIVSAYTLQKNLEEDEATFNDMLVYPFMKATTQVVARGVEGCNAEFDVGERFLKSMGK